MPKDYKNLVSAVAKSSVWKEMNPEVMRSNQELRAKLDLVTQENKHLQEIISQLTKEIAYLRGTLTVGQLSSKLL